MSDHSPYHSPLFEPLQPWLKQLPARPDVEALCALAEQHPRYNSHGQRLRFVPPANDGLAYESRIDQRGEVETRPDNWHDFFNALVWLTFPRAKNALSASHAAAMGNENGNRRGSRRDRLTHFDECGMVILSSNPALFEPLRAFQWQSLFVDQRQAVKDSMRFIVFGHATYESLLAPYFGLTAKAILYTVDRASLLAPLNEQLAWVDQRLADDLRRDPDQPADPFQPLPLLGIPGITPASEDPAYYDDPRQFRPGRQARPLI